MGLPYDVRSLLLLQITAVKTQHEVRLVQVSARLFVEQSGLHDESVHHEMGLGKIWLVDVVHPSIRASTRTT